jgi:hypothetical protein
LYETVIREACEPADLRRFLNTGLLQRMWPTLWLPARLKTAWMDRFPELRPPLSGRLPPGRPGTMAQDTDPVL